jgi:hypothetical protein
MVRAGFAQFAEGDFLGRQSDQPYRLWEIKRVRRENSNIEAPSDVAKMVPAVGSGFRGESLDEVTRK